MKKTWILMALMAVVLVASLATVATASNGIGAACKAAGDIGLDHDTCVTLFNQGKNKPAAVCKFIDDLCGLENLGLNHGQCVKLVKGSI